ncbi:MAG: cell wall hydrolase [Sphingomicrobium sp.]
MLALASSGAQAQSVTPSASGYDVKAAVRQVLPAAATSTTYRTATASPSATTFPTATATATTTTAARPATAVAGVLQSARQVVAAVTRSLSASALSSAAAPAIAREAAWLYHGGWPLSALVDRYGVGAPLDEETACLATAVYFEARGESPEGQLAVARVVMNRAASGKYPPSWCATVKQPWQFSFVRNGRFPAINTGSDAWRKAQAVARLAVSNAVPSLSSDVLWYHANYVAPSWGRRLTRAEKIGAHIFYRA